jgi:hypothetical protein
MSNIHGIIGYTITPFGTHGGLVHGGTEPDSTAEPGPVRRRAGR